MWWIQHSKALTRQYAVVLVFMVGYACLPTGPVAVGEEELSVKGSAVDQDAQVAEPDSMPADVTDAALGLVSKTFVPPPLKPGKEERYRFRKFKTDDEEEKNEKKATAQHPEHNYIDLILSTDWTLQPPPGFQEGPESITVPIKTVEVWEDADSWPITADGNLTGGGGGDNAEGGNAETDNPHWAAKVLRSPSCGTATVEQWKEKAYAVANIDPDEWDPVGDNWVELKPTSEKVYASYGKMYKSNENMVWYGLAVKAGEAIAGGLDQLGRPNSALNTIINALDTANPDANIREQADESVDFMLSLQKKIFENMAWHAVAYEQCGIDEIRRLHGQGHLTDQLLAGWEDVEAEKGKESGLKMLSHEQTFVQEDFDDDAPDALIIVLNVFASPPASMLGGDPTPKSFNAYHLAEETDDPSFDDLDDRLGWESHLLEVFVQQEEGDE